MRLARILIYPIKSLPGIACDRVRITVGGALENDRRFALFDAAGRVVNGKRADRIHRVRADYAPDLSEVTLWTADDPRRETFPLAVGPAIAGWFSAFFGEDIALREAAAGGFPDDTAAPGPTILSTATLAAVAEWFPGVTVDDVRARLRANLELTADVPFAEDALFGPTAEPRPFRLGTVRGFGHNPCQRCVVPARDPETGVKSPDFQKTFARRREDALPAWSARTRFNHFYRVAVNTAIPATETGKWLGVGDALEIDANR